MCTSSTPSRTDDISRAGYADVCSITLEDTSVFPLLELCKSPGTRRHPLVRCWCVWSSANNRVLRLHSRYGNSLNSGIQAIGLSFFSILFNFVKSPYMSRALAGDQISRPISPRPSLEHLPVQPHVSQVTDRRVLISTIFCLCFFFLSLSNTIRETPATHVVQSLYAPIDQGEFQRTY